MANQITNIKASHRIKRKPLDDQNHVMSTPAIQESVEEGRKLRCRQIVRMVQQRLLRRSSKLFCTSPFSQCRLLLAFVCVLVSLFNVLQTLLSTSAILC